jgi:hypothetical protein
MMKEAALTAISVRAAGAALVVCLVSAPAIAQTAAPTQSKPQVDNQKICQKVEVIGSRIASKRVCMTRAEWDDARLQDRQALERVQTQRGMKGE